MLKEDEVKEQLMSSSPDFRRLAEEHHLCEDKLQEIHSRQHMSEQDHLEEVTLKKRKLQLKDRMSTMILQHLAVLSHQPS